MLLRIFFLVCLQYGVVFPFVNEKPLAATMWPERCSRDQRVLNDCNWCVCNQNGNKFSCTARACHEVDMFGHFNDAISEHLVGMEGHGSWRSNATACQPRVHYQRDQLLCVCDDDGNWPSPVCRDLFRVMHEVELTGHSRPSALHECTPRRLYLYGCNVCLCPPEGRIDPAACTRATCSDDDPALAPPAPTPAPDDDRAPLAEVYAECALDRKYIVGCRKCICLKNNRLLCDNCKGEISRTKNENDYCAKNEPKQPFNVDCNTCLCDEHGLMYCTTRRCMRNSPKPSIELNKSVDLTLRSVDPPMDDHECELGTKFRKDCNTCFCTETADKKKALSCTMRKCRHRAEGADPLSALKNECVENTVYEANCLTCRCDVVDGVRRESCVLSAAACVGGARAGRPADLGDMHGYCEPEHVYRKDCNTCRCLSDGKTAACSSRVCSPGGTGAGGAGVGSAQPLVVDVVPVRQRDAAPCPRDHMYKVDCNFCFCLKNGNFLCTTAKCDEQ